MRILALIVGALIAISLSAPAEAFRYRTCGDKNLRLSGNSLGLYASSNSFPTGYWRDGLQNSINQFNRNPSNFYYSLYTDTNGLGLGNGQSEVWGSTDNSVLQNAPAIAYSWWQCYWNPFTGYVAYMTEGDVIFDYRAPFQWTMTRSRTGLIRYGGSARLLQGTAVHEFGHAAGLLHVNTTYNVMGSDFTHLHTNGNVTDAYIGEDAGNGTVFLYGLWAGGPLDVAVEHFKYLGASGEYSTHQFTKILNSSGGALPYSFTVAGMTGYYVQRGQLVRAEFTYENNGRATVAVPIRFFVSGDDTINLADQNIGTTGNATLGRDTVSTWAIAIYIPWNLTVGGTYYLGAYINPVGTISESDYSNNASFLPIRIY